jgi:hypothetical protein
MSRTSHWYLRAHDIIRREITKGRAEKLCDEHIRGRVDDAYPFGLRQYFPYKMWLAARFELYRDNNLLTEKQLKYHGKRMQEKAAKKAVDDVLLNQGIQMEIQ